MAYASPGRYIDRLERRNGEWRVLERKVMMSFFYPTEIADVAKHSAAGFPVGRMDRDDPSYVRGSLVKDRVPVI
jgi:hypothetical protein